MQTIAETKAYASCAQKLLTLAERNELVDVIASNPKAGDLIQGTGGIRKLRFARGGSGKSGGVRVVYYYHDPYHPILLLTLFGKNETSNLTQAERAALGDMVKRIKQSIRSAA